MSEALQKELKRKEELILRLQRSLAKQEDLREQMRNLIADRDHWKAVAQHGSRTLTKKVRNLEEKLYGVKQ